MTFHYCDKKDNKTEAGIAAKNARRRRKEEDTLWHSLQAAVCSGSPVGTAGRHVSRLPAGGRETFLAAMSGLVAATAAGDRTSIHRRLPVFVCYAKNHIPIENFHHRLSEAAMLPAPCLRTDTYIQSLTPPPKARPAP